MAVKPSFHVGLPRSSHASGRPLWTQAQRGMRDVQENFRKFCDWLQLDVTPEVLVEALDPTMDLSDHYAPKDTRRMVDSRYNKVTTSRGGKVRAEVGYNEHGEAPYTIFVHEMPHFYHQPPTQYKFLQRAMDEDLPEVIGRVAAGIKKRTGL